MVKDIALQIVKKIEDTISEIDENEAKAFINEVIHSRNIFVVGAGRSGLVARAFAMRLMHLGLNVYVIGETITPPIRPGDLLIAISGSGETLSTLTAAQTAKKLGARIAVATSFTDSPLAKIADCIVRIKGRVKARREDYQVRQLMGEHEPLTPLGTLFELSTLVFLDSVITRLMQIFNKREIDLIRRHANIE
ncbi:MAG: 6-phospho-3-hexuloisomerase [Thermoprotei archaeon]|nr:6-phospho-3-hexuloisomerase [Thermoprotei archaeon]